MQCQTATKITRRVSTQHPCETVTDLKYCLFIYISIYDKHRDALRRYLAWTKWILLLSSNAYSNVYILFFSHSIIVYFCTTFVLNKIKYTTAENSC